MRATAAMLPQRLVAPLREQLRDARTLRRKDLNAGPYALEPKYREAAASWRWQHVFPERQRSVDARPGETRRHHLSESSIQKAVKCAICGGNHQARQLPRVPSFLRHAPAGGGDTTSEPCRSCSGHADLRTTTIYTHMLNRGGLAVRSPLDA